jgi:hypothetical protein
MIIHKTRIYKPLQIEHTSQSRPNSTCDLSQSADASLAAERLVVDSFPRWHFSAEPLPLYNPSGEIPRVVFVFGCVLSNRQVNTHTGASLSSLKSPVAEAVATGDIPHPKITAAHPLRQQDGRVTARTDIMPGDHPPSSADSDDTPHDVQLLANKYDSYAGPDRRGRWVLAIVFAFFAFCYGAYSQTSRVDRVVSAELVALPTDAAALGVSIQASLLRIPVQVALVSETAIHKDVQAKVEAALVAELTRVRSVLPRPRSEAGAELLALLPSVWLTRPAQYTSLCTASQNGASNRSSARAADAEFAALRSATGLSPRDLTFFVVDAPAAAEAQWTVGPGTIAWAGQSLNAASADGFTALARSLGRVLTVMLLPHLAAIAPASTSPVPAADAVPPPSAYGLALPLWGDVSSLRLSQPPRSALALAVTLAHATPADGAHTLRASAEVYTLHPPSPTGNGLFELDTGADANAGSFTEPLQPLLKSLAAAGLAVTVSAQTTFAAPLLPPSVELPVSLPTAGVGARIVVPESALARAVTGSKSAWDSPLAAVVRPQAGAGAGMDAGESETAAAQSRGAVHLLALLPPRAASGFPGGVNSTAEWLLEGASAVQQAPPLVILPRWGGATLLSPSAGPSTAAAAVAAAAAATLRTLIGLPPVALPAPLAAPSDGAAAGWELLLWQRTRAWDAADAAVSALTAAASLVVRAEHMPFSRALADAAARSAAHLRAAALALSTTPGAAASGDAVGRAEASLLTASSCARGVLFDPGMVPLLYFPEEHVYAVYAPLFAPIVVPVIAALVKMVKAAVDTRRRRRDGTAAIAA